MQETTKRQVKSYSQEERQAHVDTWRSSGLSMSEYSRRSGISVSNLSGWNSQGKTKSVKLKPAVLTSKKEAAANSSSNIIEIILNDKITIKLSSTDDLLYILPYIKGTSLCS